MAQIVLLKLILLEQELHLNAVAAIEYMLLKSISKNHFFFCSYRQYNSRTHNIQLDYVFLDLSKSLEHQMA